MRTGITLVACLVTLSSAYGGEKSIASLRNFCDEEVKATGLEVLQPITVHIKALGGGGDYGWTTKTDRMFGYGWIINADTRDLVWKMTNDNTSRKKGDRTFDGTVTLEPGSYEAYFTVYAFSYHTMFTNLNVNIDHREKPLLGKKDEHKRGFLSWFKDWWSDDVTKEWQERCKDWGMDLLVDESVSSTVSYFAAPKPRADQVFKAVGLGENVLVRQGISVAAPVTLSIYALGESRQDRELVDYGWIVNAKDRERVWEMSPRNTSSAGGAVKNVEYSGALTLEKGDYVLYYITDGSHSAVDWNDEPPNDPLDWGIQVCVPSEKEKGSLKLFPYKEDANVIVSITKVKDNAYQTEGFTLKRESKVRVYAFGERSNSRRVMADYGFIMDAGTRNKVWTMDVDRTSHGGGASKNRYLDEIITLPKGNYVVTYVTDDSHSYGEWNDDPPFDPDHYGITVMGAGDNFSSAYVSKYVEERDKNVIAQIVRVGDDADRTERFSLNRTTRVRIYSIGEGQNREMYDYGWIEDARTGNVVWEMTYAMTFYAGGGRKNRMVNTTVLLEKGDYRLRFRSDDSHSFGDWNVDPPDDPQYWGITLYRDEGAAQLPAPPEAPRAPELPREPR